MKNILITGANKGIGFEIARQLGQLDYHVILSGRSPERLRKAAEELRKQGVDLTELVMDVADQESIQKAYSELSQRIDRLDAIINNAAVLIDETQTMLEASYEQLERTIKTNCYGPLIVVQTFLPIVPDKGRIVNLSSGLGAICSGMIDKAPIYSVSKTALNAITVQLSFALADRQIAVNSMDPGWVKTDMGGPGAVRHVSQGAETAVWLATEAHVSLTGGFYLDKKRISW